MALTKVTYVDNVTVIGASNLNAIQDEIIANGTAVANLSSGKVDKINGKGLSTNDFSDELALKLSNIEAGATHVEVDDELSENSTNAVQNKVVAKKISEIEGNDPYASFEEKTVSGAVANFPDGAKDTPVKSLVVNVDPVQDLHGQANPYPAGGGKNVFPLTLSEIKTLNTGGTWTGDSYERSGVTITFEQQDGYVTAIKCSGNASATNEINLNRYNLDFMVENTSYIISGCPTDGSGTKYKMDIRTNSGYVTDIGSGATFTAVPYETSPSNQYPIRIVLYEGYGNGLVFKPMIRLSTESDATFAPYSNICPITGHTGANVVRTGKNLLDVTQNESGGIDASGVEVTASTFRRSSNYISCKPNIEYTLSANSNYTLRLYFYDINKNFISPRYQGTNAKVSATSPDNAAFIRWSIYNANQEITEEETLALNLQLELGSTASTYEPFSGTTIPITFPDAAGTVYGGTLTNEDGEWKLRVDRKILNNSSTTWTKVTGNSYRNFYSVVSGLKYLADKPTVISSAYKGASNNSGASSSGDNYIWVWSNSGNYAIAIKDTSKAEMTESQFKEAIADVQIVYELATPIEYTFTAQQVETLLGVNNIWADTGDSTVTYRADPTISSKAKELVIKAIIAPVLTEMVADTALVANDFRIVGDTLYKITSSIASGGTLTPNTNCTATTIGDQLKALLNA